MKASVAALGTILVLATPQFAIGQNYSGCKFVCETFSPEAAGVVEYGTSTVLFNGSHTVSFETDPNYFTFYTSNGSYYGLDDQYTAGTTTVSWGRYLSPAVNFDESFLIFPPGVSVSLAYIRLRSAGGTDWEIEPVDRTGAVNGQNTTVPGSWTGSPVSLFVCSDEFFSGLRFSSQSASAEPQVFEVCIPQDPSQCYAAEEN